MDSDEEELAALRSSSRYQGRQRPAEADQWEATFRSNGQAAGEEAASESTKAPPLPRAEVALGEIRAPDSDEEGDPGPAIPLEFSGFGKQKNATTQSVHRHTRKITGRQRTVPRPTRACR